MENITQKLGYRIKIGNDIVSMSQDRESIPALSKSRRRKDLKTFPELRAIESDFLLYFT